MKYIYTKLELSQKCSFMHSRDEQLEGKSRETSSEKGSLARRAARREVSRDEQREGKSQAVDLVHLQKFKSD